LDTTARPGVEFIGFNTLKTPFNDALTRQAFVYAIDRYVVVEMAKLYGSRNAVPATTLVPPKTLGRDLFGEVGITFDPQKARDLLTQAGYISPSSFPPITFFVNSSSGNFPNKRTKMANAMADMWRTNLGVQVYVYTFGSDYYDQIVTNSPDLFWVDVEADYNDPDFFLKGLFYTGSEYNFGGFSNSEFDHLVDYAALSNNPADRQERYVSAERLLCETEAALIPLYHRTRNSP
jgi:ABC-type oligopeptide transport system substrate-binding subunit